MKPQNRQEVFIEKATNLHGTKYDYSKVKYVNCNTKITIGCGYCGKEFNQTPATHIATNGGNGCPLCRYQRRKQTKPYTTLNTNLFIEKAQITHKNKYNYSLVNYVNSRTKIEIICPTHGPFFQTPNGHLSRAGCPTCDMEIKASGTRGRMSQETFITRANELYNSKYDYTKSVYANSDKPIKIICPIHGQFSIGRAEKHLSGQECSTCCRTGGSRFELLISRTLTNNNILFEREKTFDGCRSPITNRKLKYDFFFPQYNTILEFDGKQHHTASPLFNRNYTLDKYYIHDKTKNEYAHKNGYKLTRISCNTTKQLHELINEYIRTLLHTIGLELISNHKYLTYAM